MALAKREMSVMAAYAAEPNIAPCKAASAMRYAVLYWRGTLIPGFDAATASAPFSLIGTVSFLHVVAAQRDAGLGRDTHVR
jgi:hypothetical protein